MPPNSTSTSAPTRGLAPGARSHPSSSSNQQTTYTIRPLPYTYIHLTLTSALSPSTSPSLSTPPLLDILTAHTTLQTALTRFLGLHGTAIPVDILHVATSTITTTTPTTRNATETEMGDFWIRVPREDGDRVVAAVAASGRVGGRDDGGLGFSVRVRGRGEWLGGLVMAGAREGGIWG